MGRLDVSDVGQETVNDRGIGAVRYTFPNSSSYHFIHVKADPEKVADIFNKYAKGFTGPHFVTLEGEDIKGDGVGIDSLRRQFIERLVDVDLLQDLLYFAYIDDSRSVGLTFTKSVVVPKFRRANSESYWCIDAPERTVDLLNALAATVKEGS